MTQYGLIGYPLSHSFSKQYFTEKFKREEIKATYELFELPDIQAFPTLLKCNPALAGLNVTIPHKQAIIPYLTQLAPSAEKVGAVNVIKIEKNGSLVGHNSDYTGFRQTLEAFIDLPTFSALVLGNGGAGKAVEAVLQDLGIAYAVVARQASIKFEDVTTEMIDKHKLIINATPLGMYPHIASLPTLPYKAITSSHFVYDLVYNPTDTLFLQKAKLQGAKTMHGLEMLYAQAEAAWLIFGQ